MNYAVEQRLRMIDFLLHYYGSVARAELIDFFGIGSSTATRDFALYAEKAPGNALVNQMSKRWVKSDTFKRLYS